MDKKLFFIIITCLIIIVGGILIWQFWSVDKNSSLKKTSVDYSIKPIAECVGCLDGRTWDNKPCCHDNFEQDCISGNGVIRVSDLHPVSTYLKGCYQKAPDSGNPCAFSTDCLSGVCHLEDAINSGSCTLIKKEFTGEHNRYYGDKFYIATYSCTTSNPGRCAETIDNYYNPGGQLHYFRMEGKTLIETLTLGPIS